MGELYLVYFIMCLSLLLDNTSVSMGENILYGYRLVEIFLSI